MRDPDTTRILAEIYDSVNRILSLSEQVELSLPISPFLLDYKVNLGANEFDVLQVLMSKCDRAPKCSVH